MPKWVGAAAAFALWVLSSWMPTVLLLVLLAGIGTGLVQPLWRWRRNPNGSTDFEWTGTDWYWVIVLMVVVYAMVEGIDPGKLIAWVQGKFSG